MITSIEISLKAFEYSLLKKLTSQIVKLTKRHNSQPVKITVWDTPIQQKIFTVLRSPHIDKKSREQFQLKIHRKNINVNFIHFLNKNSLFTTQEEFQSSILVFLENLKYFSNPGVQMQIKMNYNSYLLMKG